MNRMMEFILVCSVTPLGIGSMVLMAGCEKDLEGVDQQQAEEQAKALAQAHAQIGMPAVTSFSEKHELKDLYEMRDKPFPTHTYLVNEFQGCLIYLGASMGYGLPYSTQYTSPTHFEKVCVSGQVCNYLAMPQAEPNGLFMPTSAEGTWIQLKGPDGDVKPVYVEPRVVVSPWRLPERECAAAQTPAPTAKK
jgi:hypothetical protein